MKAKKLLIPAMAIALSIGLTACGPNKDDKASSGNSGQQVESNSATSSNNAQNNPQSSSSSSQQAISSNYKYKVAEDPKDFSVELLNKDSIRCNSKTPCKTGDLILMEGQEDSYKDFKKKYPPLDISFHYDNFEKCWKSDISMEMYAVAFIKKHGEEFTPTYNDISINKCIIIENSDDEGNVKTPIVSESNYQRIQAYLDENGAGEYEIRFYVRDENADDYTEYHLHSVIPFTVKEYTE